MSVESIRNSDGGYATWPSPQVTHRERWRVKFRQDFPDLGEGFVGLFVYRQENPDEVYRFAIGLPEWETRFDVWVVPGRELRVTGDLFLHICDMKALEGYAPGSENEFVGWRKRSNVKADVQGAKIRVRTNLTQGSRMNDGRERYNHWSIVELGGDNLWRCRIPLKKAPAAVEEGSWYEVAYNRRIDVIEFEPVALEPSADGGMPL